MRYEDWPERLNDYLSKPHAFDWETCNCALFAADAVIAMTGHDFAKVYRGPKTKRGMISRMLRVSGGDVVTTAIKEGGNPKQPSMAKRGDVVSIKYNGMNILGICNGGSSFFISENEGLIIIPTLKCSNAWEI